MEAEVIASCFGARAAAGVRHSLAELGMHQGPTPVIRDSQATVHYTKSRAITSRTRHFGVKEMYLRQEYQNGNFEIVQVSTDDQWADICTKLLGPTKHEAFCRQLFETSNWRVKSLVGEPLYDLGGVNSDTL